jgi:uncharacterized protein
MMGEAMQRRSDNVLVFMAKWPAPGRAKTRLSPPLSPEAAALLARAFLLDTLAEAATCDADLLLAYAPAGAESSFRSLVGDAAGLVEAETGHLGLALERSQSVALEMGYRRVALVASDLPHLDARRYAEGFAALATADVAIGPSSDGGYYMLASERPTPDLFCDIPWSTSSVYEQTVTRAAASALSIETIATCDDVDTAADLVWLIDALRRRPVAGHTLPLLERYAALLEGAAAD